jgi:thiamine transport system permease protein
MADGPDKVKRLPAIIAGLTVFALTAGTLGPVIWRAGGFNAAAPADWAAIRFTLIQAGLSAIASVVLAVPVARALARRRFPGRRLLITALGAPFILPVIVAVIGLLIVFGRGGWVNAGLSALGLPTVSIYGLHGVVLAHVFFNLPLAVRLILQGWLSIPAERFRLAASLGFAPRDVARVLERPMLAEVLPATFVAVFLICLSSFAVALTLGGGPGATTLELAIYQAFRFDFDLARASVLALIQGALCVAAAMAALALRTPTAFGAGLDRVPERWDGPGTWRRAGDAVLLVLVTGFLLLPLGAVTAAGLAGLSHMPPTVWTAALRSLMVAATAVALLLAMALPLALAADRRAWAVEMLGILPLAVSPLVAGTGLFLAIRPWADPVALSLVLTALVNAAMAVPFALRALIPAAATVARDYGRLADSLGMQGWARLRLVTLPRMGRAIRFSAGLAAALSIGDLGVAALFGDPARATLPVEVFRLMAAYRMEAASGAALLLLGLSLGVFSAIDRGGRADAAV